MKLSERINFLFKDSTFQTILQLHDQFLKFDYSFMQWEPTDLFRHLTRLHFDLTIEELISRVENSFLMNWMSSKYFMLWPSNERLLRTVTTHWIFLMNSFIDCNCPILLLKVKYRGHRMFHTIWSKPVE